MECEEEKKGIKDFDLFLLVSDFGLIVLKSNSIKSRDFKACLHETNESAHTIEGIFLYIYIRLTQSSSNFSLNKLKLKGL